ncbi:MAG TPA: hypothetical protein VF982_11680 [Anaerolineales bacterium]
MKKQLPTHLIANELAGSSAFFPNGDTPPVPQTIPIPREEPAINNHDAKPSANHDTTVASNHATMPPRQQDGVSPEETERGIEPIRQVVKQVGKEAATYRLTREEKRWLGELVYRFGQKGYRTSENEITRIAINWLLRDHQAHGAKSVLAQLLEALHR